MQLYRRGLKNHMYEDREMVGGWGGGRLEKLRRKLKCKVPETSVLMLVSTSLLIDF